MEIFRETCFLISAVDEPGAVARITAQLMEEKVYLSGIWGFGMGAGDARVIVVPEDIEMFKAVAERAGWNVETHICFRLIGEDTTGALVDILNKISAEKINLHAVDAIAVEGSFGCYLWSDDNDVETVAQVLGLSTPFA